MSVWAIDIEDQRESAMREGYVDRRDRITYAARGSEVDVAASWSEIVPGLWRSEYLTGTNIGASSFALRLKDGEIAVLSPPVGADEAFFAATEKLGKVGALVAPNSGHDLGQAAWQARYPDAGTFAPEIAVAAIAKAKPKLRAMKPLSALAPRLASGTTLNDPPGTSSGIAQFAIESGKERILFVDEGISNAPKLMGPAPFRFVFWLTGSGPGVARNKVWWFVFAKDKRAVAKQILGELDRLKPTMLMPLHGDPITGDGVAAARALLEPLA
jgi:hypothetical protein